MNNKIIFLLSVLFFSHTQLTISSANKKQKIQEKMNQDDNILINMFYEGNALEIEALIKKGVNALYKDNNQQDALDHLIDTQKLSNKHKVQLAPLLIDLMVRQGLNIHERIKLLAVKKKELEDRIIEYQEGDINQDMQYLDKQFELEQFQSQVVFIDELINMLKIEKDKQNLKKSEEEYQAAEPVLIAQNQQLVVPQVVQNNIKEFFELPKGDQIVVHQMKKAIRKNNMKKLGELIVADSKNIELSDERGYTPLLQAVYTNRPDAVNYLIKNGANLKATIKAADDSLMDALALARLLGHKEMVNLLAPYWGQVKK